MPFDLTSIIENPAISAFIVFLLANLLPAERLQKVWGVLQGYFEKWPILGALLKIIRKYIETTLGDREAAKVLGAGELAEVLVGGAEQLKLIGKLDSEVAAAQITQQLVETYKLDEATARKITEKAVADLTERQAFNASLRTVAPASQPASEETIRLTETDAAIRR